MRWLLALGLVVALAVGINAWSASGPDLTCPGGTSTAFRDATYGMRTPRDALGKDLEGADRVVEEAGGSVDLPTVTYWGYDGEGDLIRRVVVEGGDKGWVAATVDTCE